MSEAVKEIARSGGPKLPPAAADPPSATREAQAPSAEPGASLLLLAILASLAALGTLSTNILLPSLPHIAGSFGIGTADTAPALSAFFVTFALGQLVVGPLSDRFGRRGLVLIGLAVFVAGSVWCALAPSLPLLVAGRVVQALGVCAASVLSRAIARDLFEGAALGRVLAFIMVAMAAAPGFSPILGGALDHAFGWRSAFVLVAVAGVAAAAAYALFVGETHHAARVALDPLSIARGYLGLSRDRRFFAPAGAVAMIMGALFAVFSVSPAILMDGLAFSPIELGLFFAATVLVVFAAGFLAPRLAAAHGARRAALFGLATAFAGSMLLLALAGLGILTLAAYVVPLSVFLFGMGLLNPLATSIALSPFGDRAGLASALLGFLQMAGAAIGIMVATALPLAPVLALGIVLAALTAGALILFVAVR